MSRFSLVSPSTQALTSPRLYLVNSWPSPPCSSTCFINIILSHFLAFDSLFAQSFRPRSFWFSPRRLRAPRPTALRVAHRTRSLCWSICHRSHRESKKLFGRSPLPPSSSPSRRPCALLRPPSLQTLDFLARAQSLLSFLNPHRSSASSPTSARSTATSSASAEWPSKLKLSSCLLVEDPGTERLVVGRRGRGREWCKSWSLEE